MKLLLVAILIHLRRAVPPTDIAQYWLITSSHRSEVILLLAYFMDSAMPSKTSYTLHAHTRSETLKSKKCARLHTTIAVLVFIPPEPLLDHIVVKLKTIRGKQFGAQEGRGIEDIVLLSLFVKKVRHNTNILGLNDTYPFVKLRDFDGYQLWLLVSLQLIEPSFILDDLTKEEGQ